MATSNIINYFLQGAIEGFQDIMEAPLGAISYAVNQDGAGLNDIIRVPFAAVSTASAAFTYAGGYSGNNGSIVGKAITLGSVLYQPIQLTDSELVQNSPEVLTRLGNQAGVRLANDVLSASFAATITNANFPTSASATNGQLTASAGLVTLMGQCDTANWTEDRVLLLSSTAYQNLVSNAGLNQAYAFGGAEVVRDGKVPQVFGFTPYKTTIALPNACKGFVMNPNGLLLGMAYHQPGAEAGSLVTAQKLTSPKGLVLGYRSWYDASKATTVKVIDCMFGSTVGDSTALFQMK